MTPRSLLGSWRWRQRVPDKSVPTHQTTRGVTCRRTVTIKLSIDDNLSVTNLEISWGRCQSVCHVKMLSPDLIPLSLCVGPLWWEIRVCHRDKTSDEFTVFCKCVYQWRNLTRKSSLVEVRRCGIVLILAGGGQEGCKKSLDTWNIRCPVTSAPCCVWRRNKTRTGSLWRYLKERSTWKILVKMLA